MQNKQQTRQMKHKKCYKCKWRMATKGVADIIFICDECSKELLLGAIICDHQNAFVVKMRADNRIILADTFS